MNSSVKFCARIESWMLLMILSVLPILVQLVQRIKQVCRVYERNLVLRQGVTYTTILQFILLAAAYPCRGPGKLLKHCERLRLIWKGNNRKQHHILCMLFLKLNIRKSRITHLCYKGISAFLRKRKNQ